MRTYKNVYAKKRVKSVGIKICVDKHWIRIYIYIYMYIHVFMYVCMYECIFESVYVCMHACMHVCIYVSMYLCIYVIVYVSMSLSICASMYLCMHACMYVCMYVCVNIYIYNRTYAHILKWVAYTNQQTKPGVEPTSKSPPIKNSWGAETRSKYFRDHFPSSASLSTIFFAFSTSKLGDRTVKRLQIANLNMAKEIMDLYQ